MPLSSIHARDAAQPPCNPQPLNASAKTLSGKALNSRPYFQGDSRDSDGHGGQQYVPLMDTEIK